MIFQQLLNEESGCLSYVIGCSEAGRAIIVDPGRDRVAEYLGIARKKGLKITHVVETHTHADHISGNRDLVAATQATIVVHHAAPVVFDHEGVRDGDVLRVGSVELKMLHTPGHTPDSMSILVTDTSRGDQPWFVLTGDTLFIGSVGRPDLGGARAAEDAFESLTRVLLPLDDSVEVYPGHGAGSMCGRAMSGKTGSTIGFERRFNPALQFRDKARFVDFLMQGVPPKPPSFDTIVAKNRGLTPLMSSKPRPFTAREAWAAAGQGTWVVDVRDPATFGEGHVPGAINVWIDGSQFAERVSWFVPAGVPVLLVPQGPSDVERATPALARVGVDDVQGFLQWGMIDWRTEGLPIDTVPQMSVHDLEQWIAEGHAVDVVDVREPAEWAEGHIHEARHVPMLEAVRRRDEIVSDRPKAIVCAGGLRSSAVISALKRHGLSNFYNVTGGMTAWRKAGYAVDRSA